MNGTSRRAAACLLLAAGLAAGTAQAGTPVAGGGPNSPLWNGLESAAVMAGGLTVDAGAAPVRAGTPWKVRISLPRDGYLNVVTIGADGTAEVLFPNSLDADNHVKAGQLTIPTPAMNFEIRATPPFGRVLVAAFLSTTPLDLSKLADATQGAQALQSVFAAVSPAASQAIQGLASKNLSVFPREAPLLAGKTEVLTCDSTGPCGPDPTQTLDLPDAMLPGIFLDPEDKGLAPKGPLRKVTGKGLRLTEASEGFRPIRYNDIASYCTIAYGHLIKKAPCKGDAPETFPRGVTNEQGESLLAVDMELAERVVMREVKAELTDGQYAALADFTYNVGGGNFAASTLLKVINAHQFDRVPAQLRLWVKAGKVVSAPGLVKRRENEILLFFEGLAVPKALDLEDANLPPIDIRSGESTPP